MDTGWITDERPHYTEVRLAEEGFHALLALVIRRRPGQNRPHTDLRGAA
ncbi:hypothetical protein [Nocardia colli]|nr:hypothetical protein [Nocardia colli]